MKSETQLSAVVARMRSDKGEMKVVPPPIHRGLRRLSGLSTEGLKEVKFET